MAQFQEPNYGFGVSDPIEFNCMFIQSGFSELEEVLSRFQGGSSIGLKLSRTVCSVKERKQRRMVSNRESARRSRLRKKQHLEHLNTELNRLKVQNQEINNRYGRILWLNQMVQLENERLMGEYLTLWSRLVTTVRFC